MPINEFDNRKEYEIDKDLPHHLEHKPVYAMPYSPFDGMYANKTDCKYLSIGFSQWDSAHISLKTMRFSEGKWSRQAEELPLHRNIDATHFIAKVLLDENKDRVELEKELFENQNSAFEITKEKIDKSQNETYEDFLNINLDMLKNRLNQLYITLDRLKKLGKL